ncbi:hypothetical protein POUND7_011966, partial [Theobroma cacao]
MFMASRWATIALTTLLIRGATDPFLINQLKASSKLNLMRPRLEELRQQMQDKAVDHEASAEGLKRGKALFDEYGVTPFTPFKGLIIQGPIFFSFFMAIRNMAEKVPSFKSGGALWFVDLTTPDNLFILPVLTALTSWITVEALFCYWFTSNLFSLAYGLVIRPPEVKKLLGLPDVPTPAETASQPEFSLLSAPKRDTAVKTESSSPKTTKFTGTSVPPSVVSQRRQGKQ